MASRGSGEGHGRGLRRGDTPVGSTLGGRASSHPRKVPAGGDGGADGGLASSPVTGSDGRARSTTGVPTVLALFEDTRLGVELIGRALAT
ncbi:hypothetical protein U1Q18_023133 [Sarracenia purpurea var. burkii]